MFVLHTIGLDSDSVDFHLCNRLLENLLDVQNKMWNIQEKLLSSTFHSEKFCKFSRTLFRECLTEETLFLNQRNISLTYDQGKNIFKSKKVLLIQKFFLWFNEIDLFTLKKMFWNQQIFLHFEEMFSLTVYQRNVSLIQRNCFLGAVSQTL